MYPLTRMPFVVSCAACGKRLNIPDKLYEEKIRGHVVTIACKGCSADIKVDGTRPREEVDLSAVEAKTGAAGSAGSAAASAVIPAAAAPPAAAASAATAAAAPPLPRRRRCRGVPRAGARRPGRRLPVPQVRRSRTGRNERYPWTKAGGAPAVGRLSAGSQRRAPHQPRYPGSGSA